MLNCRLYLSSENFHSLCIHTAANNDMILKWLYSKSPEIRNNHRHESKAGWPFPTSHYSLSSKQKGLSFPANRTELMVLWLELNKNLYRGRTLPGLHVFVLVTWASMCFRAWWFLRICWGFDLYSTFPLWPRSSRWEDYIHGLRVRLPKSERVYLRCVCAHL